MAENAFWSWTGLVLLGAFHGINPGMGWLFAVAIGAVVLVAVLSGVAMLPLRSSCRSRRPWLYSASTA